MLNNTFAGEVAEDIDAFTTWLGCCKNFSYYSLVGAVVR